MLGVPTGRVVLSEYSPGWPAAFARERRRLVGALENQAIEVVHVGSTAVVGLVAKPLIDIVVSIERYEDWEQLVEPMLTLGYTHKGEWGVPGRQFFTLGQPVTHHVHACEHAGAFWEQTLLFCRVLQARADVRDAYAALKRELAGKYADARASYTAGKGEFIQGVLAEARR